MKHLRFEFFLMKIHLNKLTHALKVNSLPTYVLIEVNDKNKKKKKEFWGMSLVLINFFYRYPVFINATIIYAPYFYTMT